MKTKTSSIVTIHQRVERLGRHPVCLCAILACLLLAILKADSHLVGMMRQMYAQGFGLIGAYMREEPTRTPLDFGNQIRITSTSGR